MDAERQIRWLIAPFFFYCNLILGAWLSDCCFVQRILCMEAETTTAVIALGIAMTLPLGYFLGSVSIVILKGLFWLCNLGKNNPNRYDACFEMETWTKIEEKLHITNSSVTKKNSLFAAASFDHGTIVEGVHKWIARRWNAFNTAMNCAVAIIASFISIPLFDSICFSWSWLITCILTLWVLGCLAFVAWKETMGMIEFQTKIDLKKTEDK